MEHAYKRTLLAFVPNINELKFTEKVDQSEDVEWHEKYISIEVDFLLGSRQFACLTYHEKVAPFVQNGGQCSVFLVPYLPNGLDEDPCAGTNVCVDSLVWKRPARQPHAAWYRC